MANPTNDHANVETIKPIGIGRIGIASGGSEPPVLCDARTGTPHEVVHVGSPALDVNRPTCELTKHLIGHPDAVSA